jgi:hypothetical protein
MYGSRPHWPFTWREPTHESGRCPKCRARLQAGISEDRCPYCGWHHDKALPARERAPRAVDMSLRNQIQEAIGEAEDEYGRSAEQFVDYEVPRENNFERQAFLVLFIVLLIVLRVTFGGHRRGLLPTGAPDYVWQAIFLPSLLYLLTNHTTFLLLKPVTLLTGIASAIVGLYALSDPALVPGLWNAYTGAWLAWFLLGYQVLAGVWAASLAWRDWRILKGM